MASRRISDGALMTLVLLVSLVLTLLPVDPLLRAIWPHWTAMVMIYWVLEGNRLRFFGQAWLLGLVLDIFTGTLLGQQALSLLLMSFLLSRFRNRLRFFPPWQQAVAVLAMLSIDRLIALVVFMVTSEPWPPLLWYLSPVVGMVLWPWLFLALDALRQTRRLPS
jgi:rod shape-determining protein MreD